MASVNFYLKDQNSPNKATLIYLFVSYDGKRLKYSTSEKIQPKHWNDRKQRVKSSYSGSVEVNNYLKMLDSEALRILRIYKANGESPSTTLLKSELSKVFRGTENKNLSFFEALNLFIEATQHKVKSRTTQKYTTLKNHLTGFQKRKHYPIEFDTLDINFYDKFLHYLTEDLQFLNNTVAKYIATLKTFLHWASDREYNSKFDFKKFKAPRTDTDIVYLELEELMSLYHLDLSENTRLEKVRDTFCLGCFTGLRFSDIKKLKPENIKGDTIIINSFKTKETITVPLNSFAKSIIDKYLNRSGFLQVISNQKMNDYIKELCELANIENDITLVKYRGVERVEITKPKYEFISTHTARRTFVTLSLEQGMRPEIVMQITGHKDYKTFKKYIKITDKVKEVEMIRIWDKRKSENPFIRIAK